jgi:hypothetical protein
MDTIYKITIGLLAATTAFSAVWLNTSILNAYDITLAEFENADIVEDVKAFEDTDEYTIPIRQLDEVPTYQLRYVYQKIPEKNEIKHKTTYVELPLIAADYYYGKHINASIAAKEINTMPVLMPGDRVAILANGYLTMSAGKGYIKPYGDFMYASGVCWATSTLGALMDEANRQFLEKYDMPLFIFEYGDRWPHKDPYATYNASNGGYGYSVSRIGGYPAADYRFTVNPKLLEDPELVNLQLRIDMGSTESHSWGYAGQAVNATLYSNIEF